MIEPKELQIGNYLHDNKGQLCRVEKIERDSFYAPVIDGALTHLPNHPIPLTPSILERCGFVTKKITDGLFVCEKDTIKLTILEDEIIFNHSQGLGALKILYLHQLQNLTKTLTGKELEIKL